jgi:hypothetical protein
VEAVGVGAVWRIVNCDPVDGAAAREVRTYTVRSVARGIVVLSFRDVISIDPARRDLGRQKIGTETVQLTLDRLSGTATGSYRIPLANALRSSSTTVTKAEFAFHVVSSNVRRRRSSRAWSTPARSDRRADHPSPVAARAITPVRSSVAAALAMSDSHAAPSASTRRKCSSSLANPIVAPVMLPASGTV